MWRRGLLIGRPTVRGSEPGSLLTLPLGHMSLVNSRPSPFGEDQVCVPRRLARLSVRPGITGLWQVPENRVTFFGNSGHIDRAGPICLTLNPARPRNRPGML